MNRDLPADIYPESGNRLPLPKREDLVADGAKALYDELVTGSGGSLAGLRGPGGIRLHSPTAAVYTRQLFDYLRFQAGFSAPIRELAILVAAREMSSGFEWGAHEPAARNAGLSPELIEIVKHRKAPDNQPEPERAIIELGRQVFRDRRVTPELFARARAIFGDRQLVDLITMFGAYAMTAILLDACDVQLPPLSAKLPPLS